MIGSDTGMAELGLRLIASLAVVVGLLVLIARTVNKRFQTRAGATVQVIARQQLSRGSGVAVITVGTRVLVLGTTDQQVSLLAEVEPDEIGLDDDLLDEEVGAEWPRDGAGAPARPGVPTGALAGSVLSLQTWRQAVAAVTRRDRPATADADADADADGIAVPVPDPEREAS